MIYEILSDNIYVYVAETRDFVAETPLFAAKMTLNKIKQNKRK